MLPRRTSGLCEFRVAQIAENVVTTWFRGYFIPPNLPRLGCTYPFPFPFIVQNWSAGSVSASAGCVTGDEDVNRAHAHGV